MVSPGGPPYYLYVATTRYSKELRASLEIGDTVYPYDSGVEVLVPDVGGVVVVKTSLPPDLLGRLLSSYHLSAVEYVTHVLGCVGYRGDPPDKLAERIVGYVASGLCYGRIRVPRSGGLGWTLLGAVRAELSRYARAECPETLSIEVFGRTLCLGRVIASPHHRSRGLRQPESGSRAPGSPDRNGAL